jgi:hypothetical protein
MNQLPAELKDEMQEHLRLKFNHQEASDDQVSCPTGLNLAYPELGIACRAYSSMHLAGACCRVQLKVPQ